MSSTYLRHIALAAGLTLTGPLVASAQTSPGPSTAPAPGASVPVAPGQPLAVPPGSAVPGKTPQWPVTVPEAAKSQAAGEPQADAGWSKQEIAEAEAQCTAILAKHSATVVPLPAIREGECGTPYPVQLTAIGKVELSQPAIVTCRMIEALSDWLKLDVQPAAKRHLGATVTRLDVMSSYSCRNAYGRKKSRLSEHGRANALDIKSFALNRDRAVDLSADWGLTERDKVRIAAAEAKARAEAAARAKAEADARALAEAQAKAKAAARAAAERQRSWPGDSDQPNFSSGGLAVLRGMVPDSIGRPGDLPSADRDGSALTLGQPSRLGGPKSKVEPHATQLGSGHAAPGGTPVPSATGQPAMPQPSGAQAFLRQIHGAACKRFGTVLGPEANDAHRNHFHLDMAERNGRGAFCE